MVCRKLMLPMVCWTYITVVLAEPLQVHVVFSNHLVSYAPALVPHNTSNFDYVGQAT